MPDVLGVYNEANMFGDLDRASPYYSWIDEKTRGMRVSSAGVTGEAPAGHRHPGVDEEDGRGVGTAQEGPSCRMRPAPLSSQKIMLPKSDCWFI